MNDPDSAIESLVSPSHNGGLTPTEHGHRNVIRIATALAMLPFAIAAVIVDLALAEQGHIRTGMVMVPVLLFCLLAIVALPRRKWRRWGYDMGEDRLRIVRGYLFHTDTIVPFARLQHIDVARGPVERACGVARLIVHTAGTHNATVTLPGLTPETAEAMRETMRAHIRRDMD
ncbi:MAG: PH domain-containing protein [Blastomonas sp.]